MKGLFIRIDPDLDRRLNEVCRRQGLKKGGLIRRLILDFLDTHQTPQDPIGEAEKFGIDMSMVRESLRKTPTERIRDAEQALAFVAALRSAKQGKNHDSV